MAVAISVSIGVFVPAPEAEMTAEYVLDSAERGARIAARAGGNQTNVTNNDNGARIAATRAALAPEKPVASNYSFDTETAMADPQLFIDSLFPLLQKLEDADRLALIDRLLVMAETPSDS